MTREWYVWHEIGLRYPEGGGFKPSDLYHLQEIEKNKPTHMSDNSWNLEGLAQSILINVTGSDKKILNAVPPHLEEETIRIINPVSDKTQRRMLRPCAARPLTPDEFDKLAGELYKKLGKG